MCVSRAGGCAVRSARDGEKLMSMRRARIREVDVRWQISLDGSRYAVCSARSRRQYETLIGTFASTKSVKNVGEESIRL